MSQFSHNPRISTVQHGVLESGLLTRKLSTGNAPSPFARDLATSISRDGESSQYEDGEAVGAHTGETTEDDEHTGETTEEDEHTGETTEEDEPATALTSTARPTTARKLRRRGHSDIHFHELLTRGVIVAGDVILVPNPSMPNVWASMEVSNALLSSCSSFPVP